MRSKEEVREEYETGMRTLIHQLDQLSIADREAIRNRIFALEWVLNDKKERRN